MFKWFLGEELTSYRFCILSYELDISSSLATWCEELTEKDPDAGKDWRQEEKGTTEDEMVGWHHQLNEHEFEQAPGVGEGPRRLVSCTP